MRPGTQYIFLRELRNEHLAITPVFQVPTFSNSQPCCRPTKGASSHLPSLRKLEYYNSSACCIDEEPDGNPQSLLPQGWSKFRLQKPSPSNQTLRIPRGAIITHRCLVSGGHGAHSRAQGMLWALLPKPTGSNPPRPDRAHAQSTC